MTAYVAATWTESRPGLCRGCSGGGSIHQTPMAPADGWGADQVWRFNLLLLSKVGQFPDTCRLSLSSQAPSPKKSLLCLWAVMLYDLQWVDHFETLWVIILGNSTEEPSNNKLFLPKIFTSVSGKMTNLRLNVWIIIWARDLHVHPAVLFCTSTV